MRRALSALLACYATLTPLPARAALDNGDRGPTLAAGSFALRVTNAGILGNAFFDRGLSFDPSLEFPRGSGQELLGHAELWVGAVVPGGARRVSGGPMLEWRPTRAADDLVRRSRAGAPGSLWQFDDDGDGRVDEDGLDGRDNDGDGRIDEDYGVVADEILTADYRDDDKASIDFVYPTGEAHRPLSLTVHQEAVAWGSPGFDHIAGIRFVIRNEGLETLKNIRLGLYADLDSRSRSDAAGHLDDHIDTLAYRFSFPEGNSLIHSATDGDFVKPCFTRYDGVVPVVSDARADSPLPAVALLPLFHTTDPLGYLINFALRGAREAQAAARAPRRDTTWRYSIFSPGRPAGAGGPPVLDADRYAALAGEYPQSPLGTVQDQAVLLSCGPFATLAPQQSLEFAVAFVVAPARDSLVPYTRFAGLAWRGTRVSLAPDLRHGDFSVGETGDNGHEVCYEPPAGLEFDYDPHCPPKFYTDYLPKQPTSVDFPTASQVHYAAGGCVWSDFDCDACTGMDGRETQVNWLVGGLLPPKPTLRVIARDTSAVLAWDNTPEVMLRMPGGWRSGFSFGGYRIYRLDDWRRESILPSPARWQQIAQFRPEELDFAGPPLARITDPAVGPDTLLYGLERYPPGRYRFTDHDLRDGFDYQYVVTTILSRLARVGGHPVLEEFESPFTAEFDDRVSPQYAAAEGSPARVWVVPNPYRAKAPWERTPVAGDALTRHLDFFGMPRARSTIRIYTLAGDLVQILSHDGTQGDGQAEWDLISRNGQDVASGVYLFTVESALGRQTGRFVVLR